MVEKFRFSETVPLNRLFSSFSPPSPVQNRLCHSKRIRVRIAWENRLNMGNKNSSSGIPSISEIQSTLGLQSHAPVVKEELVEDRDPSLARIVSTAGTGPEYTKHIAGLKLLPIGSAFYTTSGALRTVGINGIIHAAIGSISREGKGLTPTLSSVSNCVKNSIILAKRNNHTKVAIPFIGGMIFLQRTGLDPDVLARAVIRTAIENKGRHLEVRLVTFGEEHTNLFQTILTEFLAQPQYSEHASSIAVCPGDITKFETHGCDVIVNAANIEGRFFGGVSGAIALASQNAAAIDKEAAKTVMAYIGAYLSQHA